MRGRNVLGRFTTRYEVHSIGDGITSELQNPVGQTVLWWVFNVERTHIDPTYDVGSYWQRGRVWYTPFEIPVVLATIEQGAGGHNERGQYTVDFLQLIINTPEILSFIPSIVWEPDKHLNDRIEYRGGLFQPTTVMPKGHVQHDMVVIRVIAEQIKDEEVVNDVQFNGLRPYPSPFSDAFNPKEFESEIYPPDAEFSIDFRAREFDTVSAEIDVVEYIERWGSHHAPDTSTSIGLSGGGAQIFQPRKRDLRPKIVNLAGYAGNPITLAVRTPTDMVGLTWAAQVRSAPSASPSDAVFTIIPSTGSGPTYLVLSEDDTRALVDRVYATERYQGVWDVQITYPDGFSLTLAKGSIIIDLDVTRETP